MASRVMRRERLLGAEVPTGVAWTVKSAVAGIVAGAVMAVWAMVVAGVFGLGFWAPVRAIAAVFLGADHVGAAFAAGPVLVGSAIHMGLSAAFGFGYALVAGLLVRALAVGTQVVLGVAWGAVLWFVNTFALGPLLQAGAVSEANPAWSWFVAHLLYGAVLGLLYDRWRHDRTMLTATPRP
jgi:hypothetical protein